MNNLGLAIGKILVWAIGLLAYSVNVSAQVFTEFSIPTPDSQSITITAGPDGNLWFTERRGRIGRITPGGVITEFPVASNGTPTYITAGPDGNLWFTDEQIGAIGRITPSGVISEFVIPSTLFHIPLAITAGPDGNLWFTEYTSDESRPAKIGRITTSGVITEFEGFGTLRQIAAGSDGNLWFTAQRDIHFPFFEGHHIGRITTSGVLLTPFLLPEPAFPMAITMGPDGFIWITNGDGIGRITTSGLVTQFRIPSSAGAQFITAGPDGNLWFTESLGNKIGRINTSGVITEFSTPGARPQGITAGPDGNLWFVESGASKIARFIIGEGTPTLTPLPPSVLLVLAGLVAVGLYHQGRRRIRAR